MNSRQLLKQCFTCKHNLKCWRLEEQSPDGIEARYKKIKFVSLVKWIWGMRGRSLKQFEYSGIRTCIDAINPSIAQNRGLSDAYTQQIMAVLEAHACSKDDWWCCPGDDPDAKEKWIYEVR